MLGRNRALDGGAELCERDVGAVVVADSRELARDLREREVGDAVAVRDAPADDRPPGVEPADELVDEARLPDTRVAEDRHELRRSLALDPRGREPQQRHVVVATDERRRLSVAACADLSDRLERGPCTDGPRLALRVELDHVPVRDVATCRALRSLADEHRSRHRELLQARRDVHGVAAHHQLASGGGVPARDDLARVYADAKSRLRSMALAQDVLVRAERRLHRECRAHGALGVVFVRARDAEHGEHRVAGELLAHAAEALHLGVHQREELSLQRSHVLGVEALAERGRADEVGEQDGHHAPLFLVGTGLATPRACVERRPAVRAERRRRRLLGPAGRALPEERRPAHTAEAVALAGLGAARDAGECHAPSVDRPIDACRPRWAALRVLGRAHIGLIWALPASLPRTAQRTPSTVIILNRLYAASCRSSASLDTLDPCRLWPDEARRDHRAEDEQPCEDR